MKTFTVVMMTLFALCLGAFGSYYFLSAQQITTTSNTPQQKQPLYWVAPMDPNYRRDQPGLSPMGMALIPVYEEESAEKKITGAVHISAPVSSQLNLKTAPVQHIRWQESITSFAHLTYDEEKMVHLHSRVAGWIENLYVKSQGQKVLAGDPLYTFYSPELAHAQEELVLALKSQDQRLIQGAEKKLKSLYVPQINIDNIKKHQKVLAVITYYAPSSGYVEYLNIRQGMYVKPETQMLSISALNSIWLIAEVFESQIEKISLGMAASFTLDAYPQQVFNTTVDYIYPSLFDNNRLAKVRLRVDNTAELFRPNMQAKVSFMQQDLQPSIVVPANSVIRTGNSERIVIQAADQQFIVKNIKVASYHQGLAKVISGLTGDELIVTSGQFLIDSQANIEQSLNRLAPANNSQEHQMSHVPEKNDLPWVTGVITKLDHENNLLTISHQAIEQWQQPAMTMTFSLSHQLHQQGAIANYQINDQINFTFIQQDSHFVIEQIRLADGGHAHD